MQDAVVMAVVAADAAAAVVAADVVAADVVVAVEAVVRMMLQVCFRATQRAVQRSRL